MQHCNGTHYQYAGKLRPLRVVAIAEIRDGDPSFGGLLRREYSRRCVSFIPQLIIACGTTKGRYAPACSNIAWRSRQCRHCSFEVRVHRTSFSWLLLCFSSFIMMWDVKEVVEPSYPYMEAPMCRFFEKLFGTPSLRRPAVCKLLLNFYFVRNGIFYNRRLDSTNSTGLLRSLLMMNSTMTYKKHERHNPKLISQYCQC